MTSVSETRKLLEALKTILPAMNDSEIAQIAKLVYSAADRMEKENESSNPPPMIYNTGWRQDENFDPVETEA